MTDKYHFGISLNILMVVLSAHMTDIVNL